MEDLFHWGSYSRQCRLRENQDTWLVAHLLKNEPNVSGLTRCCGGSRVFQLCVFPVPMVQQDVCSTYDKESPLHKVPSIVLPELNVDALSCPKSQPARQYRGELKPSLRCPWLFGVFDGHGRDGRLNANIASMSLRHFVGRNFIFYPDIDVFNTTLEQEYQRLFHIQRVLIESFQKAHEAILESNAAQRCDSGTTAAVIVLLGRYLMTASCGDSTAVLLLKHSCAKSSKAFVVHIRLTADHSLRNPVEQERILSEKKGTLFTGDDGHLRLIPSSLSFLEARQQGLAINMSRALGHYILSSCGLSFQPTITLLDMTDIYELFKHRYEKNIFTLEARLAEDFFTLKFSSVLHRSTQRDNVEGETLRQRNEEDEVVVVIEVEEASETLRGDEKATFLTEARHTLSSISPFSVTSWRRKPREKVALSRQTTHEVDEHQRPTFQNQRLGRMDDKGHEIRNAKDFLHQSCSYLVIMSDGVSDVLSTQQISDLVFEKDQQNWDAARIAVCLTEEAAKVRTAHQIRADNCTAIVVRMASDCVWP